MSIDKKERKRMLDCLPFFLFFLHRNFRLSFASFACCIRVLLSLDCGLQGSNQLCGFNESVSRQERERERERTRSVRTL